MPDDNYPTTALGYLREARNEVLGSIEQTTIRLASAYKNIERLKADLAKSRATMDDLDASIKLLGGDDA